VLGQVGQMPTGPEKPQEKRPGCLMAVGQGVGQQKIHARAFNFSETLSDHRSAVSRFNVRCNRV